MKSRFAVLHILAGGLLVGAWLSGGLGIVLQADRVYIGPIIVLLTIYALWRGWRGDWEDTAWFADKLPVVGLLGTVLGILEAVQLLIGSDLDAVRGPLFVAFCQALVANFLGMAGYLWLAIVRRACGPHA